MAQGNGRALWHYGHALGDSAVAGPAFSGAGGRATAGYRRPDIPAPPAPRPADGRRSSDLAAPSSVLVVHWTGQRVTGQAGYLHADGGRSKCRGGDWLAGHIGA